jgi:hypothetical protein
LAIGFGYRPSRAHLIQVEQHVGRAPVHAVGVGAVGGGQVLDAVADDDRVADADHEPLGRSDEQVRIRLGISAPGCGSPPGLVGVEAEARWPLNRR